MSSFSPLYYIKQNKSRCILLILMLMLSAVIYVGGLYVTSPPSTFDALGYTNDHCVYMIDVSGAKTSDASDNLIFSRASLSRLYFAPSTGKIPEYTTGITCLYPGKALTILPSSAIVSPTRMSDTVFILAEIYPTSPATSSSLSVGFGVNIPTFIMLD